LCLAYV